MDTQVDTQVSLKEKVGFSPGHPGFGPSRPGGGGSYYPNRPGGEARSSGSPGGSGSAPGPVRSLPVPQRKRISSSTARRLVPTSQIAGTVPREDEQMNKLLPEEELEVTHNGGGIYGDSWIYNYKKTGKSRGAGFLMFL